MSAEKQASIPTGLKFLFGGSSGCCAALFTHPLDLVKNRMQLSGTTGKKEFTSSAHAIRTIVANEGPLALYSGLSAGLFRQATYTTARLGIFTFLMEQYSQNYGSPNFFWKSTLGMAAGAISSFAATPAEVSLIRMTGDGRLPLDQRRNYKNVFDALARVVREEGLFALWRGCGPTVIRAMVVNAAQLGTYSQAKESLRHTGYVQDGIFCHFLASMISGFATTVASMPVDIVKTRIQSMRIVDGKPEYTGGLDVLRKVVRNEGVFALWKGFTPYFMRIGPHTVLTLVFLEQMNSAYFRFVLGVSGKSSL